MTPTLLPEDFADLEPFATTWCLPTEPERWAQRLASSMDERLAGWINDNVSFVSSVVDRITPAWDPSDSSPLLGGLPDRCAVVTEASARWVISGEFPAGRPPWELAGVQFVEDLVPFERRKLWLLNAGHTLLASLGSLRGHSTIAEATADPVCRVALDRLWDDACDVLPFSTDELQVERELLVGRFLNPGIRHSLNQVGLNSELKLSVRVVPVIAARLAANLQPGDGELTAIAAWALSNREPVERALERLSPNLHRLSAVRTRLTEVARNLVLEGVPR